MTGLAAIAAQAQPLRIIIWQVPDIQPSKPTNGTPVIESPQLAAIASALGKPEADAIILYGISDQSTLKLLAESITPKKHSVAIHTAFRQSSGKSPIIGLPIGVLTRRERMASRKVDWSDTGRIDLNGGFVFATIRNKNDAMAIYVATLPGPLTNGIGSADGTYFARKRAYAAEFLGHHAAFLASTYQEHQYATFLTGDFNLTSRKPVKDECAALLEKAGFRAVPVGAAQDKSTLPITAGPLLNRVFDPVFTKNVDFMATRQIPVPGFELPMIVCEITIKPLGSAAISKPARKPEPPKAPVEFLPPVEPVPAPPRVQLATTPMPAIPAPPTSAPVRKVATASSPAAPAPAPAPATAAPVVAATKNISAPSTPPWVWPVAISGAFGLIAVIVLNTRAAKRRQPDVAVSRPMFVELHSNSRANRAVTESTSGAVLSEPTTATDNAHNGAWQTPSVRLNSAESEPKPQNDPKAALVPHLRQLMREKLFQWLSNQRSQLLDSHENGTAQVRGLEERLGKIRDQFQDKLVAQEQRIAEMDRALREKERLLKQSQKTETQDGQSHPLN